MASCLYHFCSPDRALTSIRFAVTAQDTGHRALWGAGQGHRALWGASQGHRALWGAGNLLVMAELRLHHHVLVPSREALGLPLHASLAQSVPVVVGQGRIVRRAQPPYSLQLSIPPCSQRDSESGVRLGLGLRLGEDLFPHTHMHARQACSLVRVGGT